MTFPFRPPPVLPMLTDQARAEALSRLYTRLGAQEILREALLGDLRSRIAMVSSFGAESVALLHMVAEVDPATPVLFINTMMLFDETLAYQREVSALLGLQDIRVIWVDDASAEDPTGNLHQQNPDACCALRKTRPLEAALEGFDGWITGRKRYQNVDRATLPLFEADAHRLKLNPLADWSPKEVRAYLASNDLPNHPLVANGYPSIGCAPCTTPVKEGEDERAGRWRGSQKTECGIHFADGKLVRTSA